MGMSVPVKGILGGVSLLGGGCAVAIPLALGATSSGYLSGPTIELTQCSGGGDSANLGEISYGESGLKKVCWKYTSDSEGSSQNEQSSKYSELFRNGWGQAASNWEVGARDSNWNDQCLGESNSGQGWVIVVEGSDSDPQTKRYGVCDESAWNSTIFVKKTEQHQVGAAAQQPNWQFWTCTSDCWEQPASSSGLYTLTKEKQNRWKEVKFYNEDVTSTAEEVS